MHPLCWMNFTITLEVCFVISTRALVTCLWDVISGRCFNTEPRGHAFLVCAQEGLTGFSLLQGAAWKP